jgi:hypothetical protein
VRLIVALLPSVLFLCGCSNDVTPAAEPPVAAPTSTPTSTATSGPTPAEAAPPPQPERRFVPNVKGDRLVDARAHLVRRGFRVRTDVVEQSSCVRNGLVLRQDPPPRSIREVGSRVTLGINRDAGWQCGLDLPAAEPALDRAGRAFVAFARGGEPDRGLLRHDVDLYLGGRLLHTIPAWRAVHRNAYGWLCPAAGFYSGLLCPLGSTRTIRRYPGPMAVTSAPPVQPCGGAGTFADRLEPTVTLTPDEPGSCLSYFAVELHVGPDGGLLAVNLIVSEP